MNLQEKRTLKTKYFAKVLYKVKRKVLLVAKKNRNSKQKKQTKTYEKGGDIPKMKSKEIKEKQQNRENRGITLIALVVTIVVLLILAAVSISMLGGENGIITQAIKAQEDNEIAEEKEKVQLAATAAKTENNWGEITQENLEDELDTNIGSGKYTLSKNGDTFTVTYNDSQRSYEVDANGNVTGPANSDDNPGGTGSLTPGNRFDEDTDLTIGDDKITIPGGATISGIPGEYEDIDEGIVIYIIPEGEEVTNWTADEDGNGIIDVQEKYDQFVWVPVKKAYVTIDEIGGNSYENLKTYVSTNSVYPMAIEVSEGTYKGILYDFADGTDAVITTPKDYTTTSSYREPAYLTDSNYADGSSYNNVGITESSLQNEFNTMVTRVASKGGFWVGRYETSSMVSDNTQDTTNRVTVIRGTTTGIRSVNWYRMYAQQKAYKAKALTESANVTSSMIWGSQWDQIMIWMKSVQSKYTDSTYTGKFYVTNAVSMGNFGTISGVDDGWSSTSPAPTGYSESYKVKNVFDLAGNVYDWTLEAYNTNDRVSRGGGYNLTVTTDTRAGSRSLSNSSSSISGSGTRATLY